METKFLLPHRVKNFGWALMALAAIFWIWSGFMPDKQFHSFSGTVFSIIGDNDSFGKTVYFKFIHTNLTFTVAGCAFIIGGLLVAFSQEVIEDEFIANLRLQSFQWAFLINYVVLFLLFVFVYGTPFLWAIIYQMFLILILFIARFHYLLLKNKN